MNTIDLTCQQLVEEVTDYLEGALAPAERARFEAHLSRCDGCSAFLREIEETIRLTGPRAEELSPADRERLVGLFRDWRDESPAPASSPALTGWRKALARLRRPERS